MIDPATGNLATVLPADLPHQAAQQFQSVDGGEARGVAIANDRDKL
jgi:hypothetical protein